MANVTPIPDGQSGAIPYLCIKGDRGGKFEAPFGHTWWLATHKEDVSPEEMKRRAEAQFGQQK